MKLLAENIDETNINQTIADLIAKHDPSLMLVGGGLLQQRHSHQGPADLGTTRTGRRRVDTEATNHRVSHDWHKILVDQKVSYLLGRPPVISAEDEQFAEQLNVPPGRDLGRPLQELAKNASNKGVEWLMPFIDAAGNFRYIIIPAEQCMSRTDYEETRRHAGNPACGRWRDEDPGGVVDLDVSTTSDGGRGVMISSQRRPFFLNGTPMGWGPGPVRRVANNEERFADLKYYKEQIDVYDIIVSDLAK